MRVTHLRASYQNWTAWMYDIYSGDSREIGKMLEDDSIDLIFTDPSYPHEFLPLYSWLSEIAARVLKPGKFCIAYSGKTALPEVMRRLSEKLDYYWLLTIFQPGSNASLWKWHLWSNHRPMFMFSNGAPSDHRWFHDAIKGGGRSKKYHAWGQSQLEAEYYIVSLTNPGDIVYDPFVGGGTTAAACKATGRKFVGSEIDHSMAQIARDRVDQQQRPLIVPDYDQQGLDI